MKKIISIGLCFSMAIPMMPINVFASTENLNSMQKMESQLETKVETFFSNELNLSKQMKDVAVDNATYLIGITGISAEKLLDVKLDNNNEIVYLIQPADDIITEVKMVQTNDGYDFEFQEEDKFNTLSILENGDIYLDGSIVKYEMTQGGGSEEEALLNNPNMQQALNKSHLDKLSGSDAQIQPYGINQYYTTRCPYGSPNDYYDLAYSNSYAYLETATYWSGIGITVFLAILGSKTGDMALAASIGSVVLAFLQSDAPYSSSASFKQWVYYHYDGYNIKPSLAVRKHSCYIYTKENYGGSSDHVYSYFVKERD